MPGPGPFRGRELFDLRDFRRRHAREQIFQILEWIETVPPTTAGMFLIAVFKKRGVRLFQ
jgi:hypothetical protein